MLLVCDVGNTNVTIGLARGGELLAQRRAASRRDLSPDELETLFEGLLALDGRGLADVEAMTVASVVPAWSAALSAVAGRRRLPLLEASAANVPIPIRVDRPAEVGADRLVNAFAAGRLYGRPAIVVDFGTATTVDVVAADGAYIGGAIAPGLELGLEALAARTAKLPRIELRRPERVIGRDTVSAMQAGTVIGYFGLAAELIRRTREELAASGEGSDPRVILTGGLSRAPWVQDLAGVDTIDPDLTLRGLILLHAAVADIAVAADAGAFAAAPVQNRP
jgi:type III pantothenate kinase